MPLTTQMSVKFSDFVEQILYLHSLRPIKHGLLIWDPLSSSVNRYSLTRLWFPSFPVCISNLKGRKCSLHFLSPEIMTNSLFNFVENIPSMILFFFLFFFSRQLETKRLSRNQWKSKSFVFFVRIYFRCCWSFNFILGFIFNAFWLVCMLT